MTDRSALLISDLERIPSILREHAAAGPPSLVTLPGDGRPRSPARPRRIVLTGLGSSRFAALAIAPTLREAGLDVVVEHASASRPVPIRRGTLVVAVSSSGSTPETVVAARRARAAGASVCAITNRAGSPLAGAADSALLLAAGDETSGVASATHAATVAVLVRLAALLGAGIAAPRILAEAAAAVEEAMAGRGGWLGAAADLLDGGAAIHLLADAAALGTAEQIALLFREGPRLEADATDAGDWLHVGIYTALPGYCSVLLAGTAYDAELIRTIHGRGGRVVAIGGAPAEADLGVPLPTKATVDPLVRALVEPVVGALLAVDLWGRTRAADR